MVLIILAIFVGFVAGAIMAVWTAGRIVRALVRHDRPRRLPHILAIIGGAAAIYPGLFLSFVIGGNLGGDSGAYQSPHGTPPAIPVAIGLSIGIAIVLGLILSTGATIGVLAAKLILWVARRRQPS